MKEKEQLTAISKHTKGKKATVCMLSRDGWVVTDKGAMGDHKEDCDIIWEEQTKYLKDLRKNKGLNQEEMGWILGISRTTYLEMENKGLRELTHKEWLITRLINENF